MSLDSYFTKIETLEFQVQYSVLSGLQSVTTAMSEDPLVQGVIQVLNSEPGARKTIRERIEFLLRQAEDDALQSYDESIAAYLFCLWKVDLSAAFDTALWVLTTGGHWWSMYLSLHVVKLVEAIWRSVVYSSSASENSSELALQRRSDGAKVCHIVAQEELEMTSVAVDCVHTGISSGDNTGAEDTTLAKFSYTSECVSSDRPAFASELQIAS